MVMGLVLNSVSPRATANRASGVVRAGAFVTLEDAGGARSEYQVVEAEAADAAHRRISVESPLGRALLGKRKGEQATVERPRGPATYRVVTVQYQ